MTTEIMKPGTEVIPASGPNQFALRPITQADLQMMIRQRLVLQEFVTSQLQLADFSNPKSGNYGDGDYGIIPGTKKRALFKPGAEKLLRLFRLGCRFVQTEKIFDMDKNFVMYSYVAEIYHLESGIVLASSEGSANSQEKKYKERTVYPKSSTGAATAAPYVEVTPIADVANTVMKMAQKRALVSATITATGAAEFFASSISESDAGEIRGSRGGPKPGPSALPNPVSKTQPEPGGSP